MCTGEQRLVHDNMSHRLEDVDSPGPIVMTCYKQVDTFFLRGRVKSRMLVWT